MKKLQKVRLKKEEIKAIKDVIKTFDKEAQIILYGSRTDINKKGGDIDLLVISKKLDLQHLLKIKARLFSKLGDRKIDIVLAKDIGNDPFIQIAYKQGIKLWIGINYLSFYVKKKKA